MKSLLGSNVFNLHLIDVRVNKIRKAHRNKGNLNGGWFKLFGSKPELLNDNQFEVTVMNIFHLDFRMPNAASVFRKKSKYSDR